MLGRRPRQNDTRWLSQEDARLTHELLRMAAEEARCAAEDLRQAASEQRVLLAELQETIRLLELRMNQGGETENTPSQSRQ